MFASAGITVITVSHRPKHKRFHAEVLTLKGSGRWDKVSIREDDLVPTPPATPRSPSSTSPFAPRSVSVTSQSGSAEYGLELKTKLDKLKPMPQMSSLRRMALIVRICLPKLSLINRGTQLIWLNVASILFNVFLTTKVLASLPGRLQAFAIQSDRAGYFSLTAHALIFRLLSALTTNVASRSGYALARQFQRVLTEHVTEKAMGCDNAFYVLRQIDKRVMDMETRVTADVDLCAKALQLLLTSMLTPLSSAIVVTRLLVSANLPLSAISVIYIYALTGSAIVRFASPDLGGFAAKMSQMEGIFRRMHQRVIAHCECIAMIGGEEPERHALDVQSDAIAEEQRRQTVAQIRFDSGNYWFNNYLPQVITNALRMSWGYTNYGSADQVMAEGGGTGLSAQGLYIENLVTAGFTAVTGILSINTSFRTFAGYARRITDVLLVIEEVRAKRAQQDTEAEAVQQGSVNAEGNTNAFARDDEIAFREVDIFAPDGQRVVSKLNLTLSHGEHLRVTGPNGCGKSAVFRVLAGTSEPQAGSVHVPPTAAMVPQQPLATTTPISLLAYVTYPHSPHARADSQVVVTALLEQLGIQYLPEREGLDSCKLWSDVLSLGELQCLACVRLLYQLLDTTASSTAVAGPGVWTGQKVLERCCGRWAILDDCTSAMDAAVERNFFQYAASQGISVVSFSQREKAAVPGATILRLENEVHQTSLLTLGAGVLGWELEKSVSRPP
jgi:ATP-binding cassette subfamily D (ALD) long-chain fatty acid import protein